MLKSVCALCLLVGTTTVSEAENWLDWRGPHQSGLAVGTGFPIEWDEKNHVVWKTAIPGWGTSSPVIFDQNIFVSAAEDDGKNVLLCLNRAGTVEWKATFGTASSSRNRKASGANPSPVTDGERVFSYYKNGDLACVDFAGKVVWQKNLQAEFGPDRLNWDVGTSPVLTKRAVVVAVMHQGPSYVVAFDKQSGEQLWKTARDLGAPAESRDSYTTPVIVSVDGRECVVVLGADHLTSYDAADGKPMWSVGNLNPAGARNFRSIASPAVSGAHIVAPYARGNSLTAVRLGGQGDVTATHVTWKSDASTDVPTPVVHDGRIYICQDRGDVVCLDADTGKEYWTERLPRNRYPYSASPIIAEGRLYLTREDGTTFVLAIGEEPKLLAENRLRENTYSTPAFVDGRVYLRTSEWLFCIGQQ